VRDARDGLEDAREARGGAAKDVAAADQAVKDAPDEAALAEAQKAADAARSALAHAERAEARAGEALADAERAAWTTMPLGAAVWVAGLPRRVDQVNVEVGTDLANPSAAGGADLGAAQAGPPAAVVLSGADILVTARVGLAEAALLQVGGPAVLQVGGAEVAGEIAEICAEAAAGAAEGAGQCEVLIAVADLGGTDPESMVGNVLATMVVGTSSADSLVVPVAAVSADTAGNARIEVVEGELEKGKAAAETPTRTIGIIPGLTAEGMVEVKEADAPLKAGDLVVIGRGGGGGAPAGEG
jgi:hypothetical protein